MQQVDAVELEGARRCEALRALHVDRHPPGWGDN